MSAVLMTIASASSSIDNAIERMLALFGFLLMARQANDLLVLRWRPTRHAIRRRRPEACH
jgi:hypothetical protein